jgi:hypothetical protein
MTNEVNSNIEPSTESNTSSASVSFRLSLGWNGFGYLPNNATTNEYILLLYGRNTKEVQDKLINQLKGAKLYTVEDLKIEANTPDSGKLREIDDTLRKKILKHFGSKSGLTFYIKGKRD